MVENRHGFIVEAMLTQTDGTAEADAAMRRRTRLS
jgi:hypothetical protein